MSIGVHLPACIHAPAIAFGVDRCFAIRSLEIQAAVKIINIGKFDTKVK
jgi:hypothetical protein